MMLNTLSIVKLNTLLCNFKNPSYVIFDIYILFYILFLKIIKKLHIYIEFPRRLRLKNISNKIKM